MPKLPRITPKRLIAVLLKQRFFVDRQRGSHVIVRHPDGRSASIPLHAHDMRLGTLKGILNDIEVGVEQLIEWM